MMKKLSTKFLIVTIPLIFVSFLVITLMVSNYEEARIYDQLSSLNRLQKVISNSKILENGFVTLMNDKNKIVFNSNNNYYTI